MFSTIISAIAVVPKLLDFVKWLVGEIQVAIQNYEKAQALAQEQKAADAAKETKDTSQLENLFDPDRPQSPAPPNPSGK